MVGTQRLEEIQNLIQEAVSAFEAGDMGAPFEPPVLAALVEVASQDVAEFQRLRDKLTSVGVPKRDLNAALKKVAEEARNSTSQQGGQPLFTLEQIQELQSKGFVIDAQKGVVNIDPHLFAKYVMNKYHLVFTVGERFYFYKNGVWKPLREKQLHRLLYREIEAVQEGAWNPSWEGRYMAILQRSATFVEEFDTDRDYINLANGMFNTNTFVLEPHDPNKYSSIQNSIEYDPAAECPTFNRFLYEIFQGDEQTIKVVQEIMGYCCTSETRAHKMFIFEGIGSNGKSVLIELIEHLVGRQNTSHVAMNELNHPFARAELVGKILNVSAENEFNEKGLNTQHIKTIVAGDMIRVENKFEKGFSYKPKCKLLFALNTLPATLDRSHGFFRRLVIVPFRRIFKGAEVDKNLLQKLLAELPGIFNFAMEGLKRLREQDFEFSTSKAIQQAVSNYKSEQNPVIPFVADYIRVGSPDDRLGSNELHEAFLTWCRRTGETDFSAITVKRRQVFYDAFKTALLEAGIPAPDRKNSGGWRYFPGLVLLDKPEDDLSKLFEDDDSTEVLPQAESANVTQKKSLIKPPAPKKVSPPVKKKATNEVPSEILLS
ncbi:hypothetical protein EDM57_00230 [Brevibacillus gelatini]|uniref:SF3 helicase domain-containing protein n=1 Tax=Brevibacillus gelatini TaxID=1655277 RepID=A0A3M8BF32_9BACL|nr:phage/plasmid primase, P4 family [Brevibacillus gelatini]RNB62019.1 hypothetical protein EDM57_00230 [Brevibacillus gelatini]